MMFKTGAKKIKIRGIQNSGNHPITGQGSPVGKRGNRIAR
jgi:hypothetical protein